MTFTKRNRLKDKKKKCTKWHVWFAWHPVVIAVDDDGVKTYAWLQNVARKGTYNCHWEGDWWNWKYKELEVTIPA